MLNEETIIEEIKDGLNVDRGFRTLVELYQEKIYWHIRSIVKVHEDANDVMQNTFIKAYKNIGNFKQDSKFYTWLYRIATNESLNFIKKNKNRVTIGMDESINVLERLNADPYFDGNQAQIVLIKAIEQLPEKQKLVFNMKYFEEMSYQDISDILKTSVGGLKASYHHAVKKIEAFVKNIDS